MKRIVFAKKSQSSLFKGIEWLSSQLQSKLKPKSAVSPGSTQLPDDDPPEKNALELIDSNMAFCIKTCRLLLAVPFTYSVKNKLEMSTSKWYNYAYRTTAILATIGSILKLYSILRDVRDGSIDMRNRIDPFRVVHFLISSLCAIMHVNFALKADEIREIWQGLLTCGKNQIKKEKLDRVDKMCGLLMKFFFIDIASAHAAVLILFVVDCRLHVLATVLPTCSADGVSHRHPLLMLPLLFIHFLTMMPYPPCLLLTADLILVAVQMANALLDDLQETVAEGCGLTRGWMTTYRSTQMIVAGHNRCYGQAVFPSFFLLLVLIFVFSIQITMTPGADLVSKLFCCTMCGGLGVFTILIIQDATDFPANTRAAVLSRSQALKSRVRSFTHATLNSCPTIKIWVYNFFYLDEELMPMLLTTIIETTIDLIVA